MVQPQPAPGSCHASEYDSAEANPDRHCTPGALNPAVTQATIHQTVCVAGWTKTVRPPSSITGKEKLASLVAYGDDPSARGGYEYDHLVSLELGGKSPSVVFPDADAGSAAAGSCTRRLVSAAARERRWCTKMCFAWRGQQADLCRGKNRKRKNQGNRSADDATEKKSHRKMAMVRHPNRP